MYQLPNLTQAQSSAHRTYTFGDTNFMGSRDPAPCEYRIKFRRIISSTRQAKLVSGLFVSLIRGELNED